MSLAFSRFSSTRGTSKPATVRISFPEDLLFHKEMTLSLGSTFLRLYETALNPSGSVRNFEMANSNFLDKVF